MGKAQGELRAHFEALVARAAELGQGAPTGSTPRELLARWSEAGLIEPAEAVELRAPLEVALYGHGLPAAELGALHELLDRVAQRVEARGSLLPDLPLASRGRAGLSAWWMRGAVGGLLAAALAFGLPHLHFAPALNFSSGATSASSASSGRQLNWARPRERARVMALAVPPEIMWSPSAPSFDSRTGVDASFAGARRLDPFRPPKGWTHRSGVFDVVISGARFARSASEFTSALGSGAGARDTSRVSVKLLLFAGSPLAVPSPSADFEVLSWNCSPPTELEFLRDASDTLFVRSESTRSVQLDYEIASFANYDTAPLPDTPFVPQAIALPDDVRADAERVLARIGELHGKSYAQTVRRLHDYFEGFAVTPLKREEVVGSEYLSLALARKGVCRHRAQAFVVTAHALGLPARYVANRIHAFAEVQLPNGSWRRLEFRLPRNGPPVTPWLLLGVAFAGALVVMRRDHRRVNHAYAPGTLQRGDRTKLRAQIDSSSGHQTGALARLLAVVRQRVALELGCDDTDPDTLSAALEHAELDPLLRRHVEQVLQLSRKLGESDAPGASELQHAYWNSYHILRVLDGSAPW
ncbi:MAG: hypothetical protein DHS20C15_05820 [Planctomycetota bacterium]|nr:MAG: hypothetical protein DHS20C15_05820 [Planctomycetota bacterium]